MAKHSYKLVDKFNGWESEERYNSLEEAEKALANRINSMSRSVQGQTTTGNQIVVPASYQWQYSQLGGGFVWSE